MNEMLRKMLALPDQASSVARGIDTLHYIVIGTSLAGATVVALAVLYMLLRFHRRTGYTPPRHAGHIPVWAEGVGIAGLLALFFAFWIVGFRQFVHLRTAPKDAMDVYVVAKQWMWTFAYPDGNATIGELYVPVGKPVRLLMTSRDVIHSFWVPEFRVKFDVLPGRSTMLWFEATHAGRFDVLCAEYCGLEHSLMRAQVIALSPGDYAKWSEARPTGHEDLAQQGERIAAKHGCLRCHTVDGTPHLGPTWAGMYGADVPLADGTRVIADEAFLTESMMDPERKIHVGFVPIMPSYRGLLDGAEVAAIVEYIRTLPAQPAGSPLPVAPMPSMPIPVQPETVELGSAAGSAR